MSSGRIVVAFDLDGTLTRKDTFLEFIRFVKGDAAFYMGMFLLLPKLLAFKLGLIRNDVAKVAVLRYFFGGMEVEELETLGAAFSQKRMPNYLRPAGIDRLRWHQEQGHDCYLVTASLTFWTQDWAKLHGLKLIATKPELIDGKFTGALESANNYGPEKVRRIQSQLGDIPIEKRFAYGDSGGDRELLAWADEGTYKPFR